MSVAMTREEAYALVWSEPVRTVAQRFGISDVGLKKHLAASKVPVPERGYWAKLAAGKRVATTPLPPRDPGASNWVTVGRSSSGWGRWDPEAELAVSLPEPPEFHEPLDSVRARVVRHLGKVKFVRDLESPCGALRKLLEDEAKRVERQRTERWPSLWDKPLFESGFEKRRLKLLNSLGLGLSKVGAKLEVRGKPGRELSVRVGSTTVSLALDHPKAKPNRYGEWQTREGASDTLKLTIGGSQPAEGYQGIWQDSDGAKLEGFLTEIAIEIVLAGEAEHRAGEHRHHTWLLKRRVELEAQARKRLEEAERKARERRLAEEKARRELLFGQAQAWRTAADIRGFVAEVLREATSDDSSSDIHEWAAWALTEADALDPVKAKTLRVAPPGED